ncbi:MAG: hypothetical protein Q8O72_00875 [Bacteroidales bacterium]|nr:hypothetical protein [Bacteroidales bacterium]
MDIFSTYQPVRLVFGNQLNEQRPPGLKSFGTHVLLIYGQGSMKKFGYYDQIKKLLAEDESINELIFKGNMGVITGMLHI